MSPRRRKVQRVLEVREQDLNEKATILVQVHQGHDLAQDRAANAAGQLAEAADYRQQLAHGQVNVASWIEAEQWLAQRNSEHESAQTQLANCKVQLTQAHHQVVQARVGVKSIELLDRRLAVGEMRTQMRIEQRLTDEHAQRRYLSLRRNRIG
jgi:flagellar export protein FliJ